MSKTSILRDSPVIMADLKLGDIAQVNTLYHKVVFLTPVKIANSATQLKAAGQIMSMSWGVMRFPTSRGG